MHDQPEATSRLDDLNQVLIEYSVFLNSMEKRRELLVPLVEAGITDAQLRTACEHTKRHNPNTSEAQIVLMIRDNPKLQATLRSAAVSRRRTEGPGARDRRENMDRELQNPLGSQARMAMRARCALKYGEAKDLKQLAAQFGVSEEKAQELVTAGAAIYGDNRD